MRKSCKHKWEERAKKIIQDFVLLLSYPWKKERFTMILSLVLRWNLHAESCLGCRKLIRLYIKGWSHSVLESSSCLPFVPFAAKAWSIANWEIQSCGDRHLGNIYKWYLYPDGIWPGQECKNLHVPWQKLEAACGEEKAICCHSFKENSENKKHQHFLRLPSPHEICCLSVKAQRQSRKSLRPSSWECCYGCLFPGTYVSTNITMSFYLIDEHINSAHYNIHIFRQEITLLLCHWLMQTSLLHSKEDSSTSYCSKLIKQSPTSVKTVCTVMMSTYQDGFKNFPCRKTTPSTPGFQIWNWLTVINNITSNSLTFLFLGSIHRALWKERKYFKPKKYY